MSAYQTTGQPGAGYRDYGQPAYRDYGGGRTRPLDYTAYPSAFPGGYDMQSRPTKAQKRQAKMARKEQRRQAKQYRRMHPGTAMGDQPQTRGMYPP